MRLKTRVTWFFILAALPAIVASTASIIVVDNIIELELKRRRLFAEEILQLSLDTERQRIASKLKLLMQHEDIRDLGRRIFDETSLDRAEDLAARLAAQFELGALAIIAKQGPMAGMIISSAHLPQSVGNAPAAELQLGTSSSTAMGAPLARTGAGQDYVAGNPPDLVHFLLGLQPIEIGKAGTPLFLYGGTRLDGPFLQQLARMSGSKIRVKSADRSVVPAPSDHVVTFVLEPIQQATAKAVVTMLSIDIPASPLEALRRQLAILGIVTVLLIILGAVTAGVWLSRPITRPIVELSRAAQKLGAGQFDIHVEKSRDDEVGELVDVFNKMVCEITQGQEALARAERVAAWRDAAKQVAHEIKNPLTPMRMAMETLRKAHQRKHESFDEILDESTQAVLDEVHALARIVTAFSEFARLPTPQVSEVAPLDLLSASARLYGTMPPGLDIKLNADLIRKRELAPVLVDRDQIGRVLINLIKNSVEAFAGHGGEITLDAHTETRRQDPGVLFRVSDNGPGMSQAQKADASKPYYTTKEQGTGLGLAIVERVIHEHHGEMKVISEPGQGTTVQIWLPAA